MTTRRNFLKSTAALTLGFYLPASQRFAQASSSTTINAWLRIGSDESITVFVAHSEMGQGVFTALPMLIAEELEADWKQIKVTMAPTGEAYQNPLIGQQLTGGSTSVRSRWQGLRIAGASAREMLIQAAAAQWQVTPQECRAENSHVSHLPSGKLLSYGQLAATAAKLTPPASPSLKSPRQFKIIGQPLKRLDTPDKVNGQAIFGIDIRLPNMLYAAVKQAPVFGSKVEAYDAETAEAFKVIPIPNGIAVVANHYWKAKQGLEALRVRFSTSEHQPENITQTLQSGLSEKGVVAYHRGEVETALKAAKKTLEVEYSVPFLAHMTMEPMNCTADVKPTSCEVWVGTQAQERARNAAAEVTGLSKEQINIHTTYLGGGFGRRFETDFITQAVSLSKAVGQPVKVIWSREEDLQHDFYRPAVIAKLTVGLDEKGKPIAMKTRLVAPSIFKRTMPSMMKGDLDPAAMEGISDLAYNIPHQHAEYVMKNTQVPVGFWRSVGHSHNAFFVESCLDEIAHTSHLDPYQLRRELLGHQADFLKVLDTLAEQSNWHQPAPEGRYRGLAIHQSFGSIVGEVAEVSVSDIGDFKVHRVTCVISCGLAVNPNLITAQAESSIVYGLSSLKEAITLQNGQVMQNNFSDYPVLRMVEMPQIQVHILPSQEKPGGMGEPATPPIVPAVTNAIFMATGQRIRNLPVTSEMLRKIV